MKKFIATALAATALAAGSAASAQDLGSLISNIFGFGSTQQGVVAGQVYADQYGRHFYYDQYGRQVYIQNQTQQIVGYDQWGRPVYGTQQQQPSHIVGYDQWGRPVYGNGGSYAYGGTWNGQNQWDRDGDGVANHQDRWPDDRRYW